MSLLSGQRRVRYLSFTWNIWLAGVLPTKRAPILVVAARVSMEKGYDRRKMAFCVLRNRWLLPKWNGNGPLGFLSHCRHAAREQRSGGKL